MKRKPLSILKCFSDKHRILIRHMEEDMEFYDLCQDYEICVNALRYWTTSDDPQAGARIDEYRSLVRELEDEIAATLKSWETLPEG